MRGVELDIILHLGLERLILARILHLLVHASISVLATSSGSSKGEDVRWKRGSPLRSFVGLLVHSSLKNLLPELVEQSRISRCSGKGADTSACEREEGGTLGYGMIWSACPSAGAAADWEVVRWPTVYLEKRKGMG
jgi:hypothetical protein